MRKLKIFMDMFVKLLWFFAWFGYIESFSSKYDYPGYSYFALGYLLCIVAYVVFDLIWLMIDKLNYFD